MESCVPKCVNVFVGEFTPQIRAVNMFHHEKTLIYVPERTCRDISKPGVFFECSECSALDVTGGTGNYTLEYCPACGAKVVE